MGYARRNFLVPIPSYRSFDELNAHLQEKCLERMERRLRGHKETIGQRMERDLEDSARRSPPCPTMPATSRYDPGQFVCRW